MANDRKIQINSLFGTTNFPLLSELLDSQYKACVINQINPCVNCLIKQQINFFSPPSCEYFWILILIGR